MPMPMIKPNQTISETDYLDGEQTSEVKHEYVDGDVYAMAGASKNHERISLNVLTKFAIHLVNSPCEAFGSDMKVRTANGNYRYPDGMVVGENDDDDDYYTESPVILVEVVSRSTRKTDKLIKRLEYINIPSLKEYVLIEQDHVDVTVYRCPTENNQGWVHTDYFLGDEVTFESIGLTLSVAEIYQRVVNQDMTEWRQSQQSA